LKSDRTVTLGKFLKLPALSVFLAKDQAISYAQNRACFRKGEIRVLDLSGNVERVIPFDEAKPRL
jgi:hypothetical protein